MNFRTRFWDRFRKVLMFVIGGVFVFSMFQRLSPPSKGRLEKGMDVPAIQMPYITGQEGVMTFDDYAGKSVLINFWATWCGPCREELPALQRLHERFAGDKFAIVGVTDEDPTEVRAFVQASDLTFPMVSDRAGKLGRRFKVRNIPFTVFVGPDGKVFGDYTGPLDEETGAERIEALLEAAGE